MKTSINLYGEELRPKVYYLTLKNLAIATALCAFVMLVWFAQISLNQAELTKQKASSQKALAGAQEELVNYQQVLIKHNDGSAFLETKTLLEREQNAKQVLVKLVNLKSSAEKIDYSVVMKELTEHHDHDMWLKHFRFNQQEVTFKGYALQSKAVTQWMSYLQATTSFKGREFSQLNISALNEEVLEFNTSTQLNDENQRGVQ